ncbi:MAG: hypothetical protein HY073_00370 [Deltaproteobacteria bacterium]|nr:hypothetical protein [Deltaproteobacteria bacterium]
MEYPYLELAPNFFSPVIPIQFWAEGRWFYSMGYVDSGASFSVFQMKVARSLGLSKSSGRHTDITVGDGDKMKVVLYPLRVRFSNFAFTAQVGFSDDLGVGFNIIGRTSFFERFRICFNDHEKKVTTLRLF